MQISDLTLSCFDNMIKLLNIIHAMQLQIYTF